MIIKKEQFIGNLKLDLTEVLQAEEEVFIEIRDCRIEEALQFKAEFKDETAQYNVLKELLPSLIVNHNFQNEDGTKWTNEEVTEFLFNLRWDIIQSVYEGILNYMFRNKLGRVGRDSQ